MGGFLCKSQLGACADWLRMSSSAEWRAASNCGAVPKAPAATWFLFFKLICGTILGTTLRRREPNGLRSEARIYAKPPDRATRLFGLDVHEDVLRDAVQFGVGHVLECTFHDPASLSGILGWGKITRGLRDRLVPLGWTPERARNYETTVHPDGGWAIVVAGGDPFTGQPDRSPTTRSEKGPATKDAVSENQRSFADIDPSFPRPDVVKIAVARRTWFLLYFADTDQEEIRSELSLPEQMTHDNYVMTWRERIILEPIKIGIGPHPAADDALDNGDIDIDIGRRAG